MWKRLVAAAAALVLAIVGVILVVAYANNADRRALEGMQTQRVLVAVETIPEGTPTAELAESVELREVPRAYIVEGAVTEAGQLEGLVATAPIGVGEQLQRTRFSTPEEIRAAGEAELPEGVDDLHQVTISLEKPRALGGNVTVGDTVGVFMSFEVEGAGGQYVLEENGQVVRLPADSDGDDESNGDGGGGGNISTTHLTLHKVPVVRVEGGAVAPASNGEEEDQGEPAQDSINVTLAMEAPRAEQLVYAMEFGTVWLSLEPDSASEDGTGVVVVTVPNEARDVYE